MFSMVIVLFLFGLIHGQNTVVWWNLPQFYLNGPIDSVNLSMALKLATLLDPNYSNVNYSTVAQSCYNTPKPSGSPLTREQAGAIACYTKADRLSTAVNNAFQRFDTLLLVAWTPFLKFFHTGIAQLTPQEKPAQLCHGNPFQYKVPPNMSVVTLPLSWSSSQEICQMFAGDPRKENCTIIRLYNFFSEKFVQPYSEFPIEQEYIMLSGTLGIIGSVIPQDKQTCRIINVYEVDIKKVPKTTNVTSLLPPRNSLTNTPEHDHFKGLYSNLMAATHIPEIQNHNMIYVQNNQNVD